MRWQERAVIHIRVELWPRGDRSRPKLLGEAVIENIGGDERLGDYRLSISKPAGFENPTQPRPGECWKTTELNGFPRKSTMGAWDLLTMTLISALRDRLVRMGVD